MMWLNYKMSGTYIKLVSMLWALGANFSNFYRATVYNIKSVDCNVKYKDLKSYSDGKKMKCKNLTHYYE